VIICNLPLEFEGKVFRPVPEDLVLLANPRLWSCHRRLR